MYAASKKTRTTIKPSTLVCLAASLLFILTPHQAEAKNENKPDKGGQPKEHKVEICHINSNIPEGAETILVHENTVDIHLSHGDTLGACRCGDGLTTHAEQCDDGNNVNNDGCDAACVIEYCGDGVVNNAVEECEGSSTTECFVNGYAGYKECEPNSCRFNSCVPVEYCGDSTVQESAGEVCDSETASCFTAEGYQGVKTCEIGCAGFGTCETDLFCGDGICSAGPENTYNCFSDCPNVCGNGILEFGENCDDGNSFSGDGCSAACEIEFCGDGIMQPFLGEECDGEDIADPDSYTCDETCKLIALGPKDYCPVVVYDNMCEDVSNMTFNIQRLTFDFYDNRNANISPNGQFVTWTTFKADDGKKREDVFVHDGTVTDQLSDNPNNFMAESPVVNSAGALTWRVQDKNLGYGHVYRYDGLSTSLVSTGINSQNPDLNECGDIAFNGILLNEQQVFEMEEIFLFKEGQLKQITTNSVHDSLTSLNNQAHIAWRQFSQDNSKIDVMYYDGTDTYKISNNLLNNERPNLNNSNFIAWVATDTATQKQSILVFNGEEVFTAVDQVFKPAIVDFNNNGQIVWRSSSIDSSRQEYYEIYMYDGENVIRITDDNVRDKHPSIADNGFVVWSGYDGQDDEIYLFDGTQIHQVTNNDRDDTSPVISKDGSALTWIYQQPGDGENDLEVYRADIDCGTPVSP